MEKVLRFLIKLCIPYAVKMPLWKWTGIKELINQRERWRVATEDLSYITTTLRLANPKVHHEEPPCPKDLPARHRPGSRQEEILRQDDELPVRVPEVAPIQSHCTRWSHRERRRKVVSDIERRLDALTA